MEPIQQTVVFQPESARLSASDLELSPVSQHIVCFKKKGKDSNITAFDLSQGRALNQFQADGIDALSKATLSPDASILGWMKSKALFGHSFKTVNLRTGDKSKGAAVDFGADTHFFWLNPTTLTVTDPYKRQTYLWNVSSGQPQKTFPFSSMFPEGTQVKCLGLTAKSSDGRWLALVEWVQWPLLKQVNPHFWAGISRIWWSEAEGDGCKDLWAQAVAFGDVTFNGSPSRLLCYGVRISPRDQMFLHIQEVEGHSGINYEIPVPTHDGSDVPRHVHVIPSSNRVVLVTYQGLIHLFDITDGDYVHGSRLERPTADMQFEPCDGGSVLYVKSGNVVTRLDFAR
ncbi:hypothetical protein FRC03_006965 [Tulasnella sp. 419]|nr:hypothetical protein FRC03_006965 [Tulasnella sp. 419]